MMRFHKRALNLNYYYVVLTTSELLSHSDTNNRGPNKRISLIKNSMTTKKRPPIGREHIECDAPGCSKPGPSKRCSRCHRAFYCSAECQRAHWKSGHKGDCSDIELIRKQCLNVGKVDESETNIGTSEIEKKEPKNTCCFICLSEPIIDPFVLPNCGHAFCFGCLQDWQGFANSKIKFHSGNNNQPRESEQPKCPACRAEAPDIVRSVHETAILYAARSHNKDLSEDEQRKYKELALEELDKVDTSSAMDSRQKIQTLFTRAEILQQLGRPEEAFQALEEVEILHQEGSKFREELLAMLEDLQTATNEGRFVDAARIDARMEEYSQGGKNIASLGDACDLYLNMAQCKEEMGDYKGAKDIYKFKLMGIMDESSTPPQQRKMLMGMSKCAYHLGNYKLAIEFGESAIGMNRYYPQVHKHVALAQKASGELAAAVRTMGRAVNYETPWDEANRKIVLEMYHELKNEAEEILACEAQTAVPD